MSIKLFISIIGKLRQKIEDLYLENKIRSRRKRLPDVISGATSYGDRADYLSFCKLAVEDDAIFNIFRKSVLYRGIVENVSRQQGQACLDITEKDGSDLLKYISLFKENDKFGCPIKFKYDVGFFSPDNIKVYKNFR